MSSLKKIYDLEVTPPAAAWNNIAKVLDVLNDEERLAQKLNNLEVLPPVAVWNNIATGLDEIAEQKSLSNKLYHIEIAPPVNAWSNIERELDDQEALHIIEKKLSQLQVQPPTGAWTNIRNILEERNKPKSLVVPMHYGWLKYAAAACFVAIISITAYFIFNDGSQTGQDIAVGTKNSEPVAGVNMQVDNRNDNGISATTNNGTSSKDQAMAAIRTKLGNAYAVSNEKNTELQGRYIILMTPDGNIVRMSKKVGNMADCIAGEDHSCDEQISQWQKEMATSTSTSGPDNFLGILDMVDDNGSSQPAPSNL